MSTLTEDERLKRLRVLAGSSVVGADLVWLLREYDHLQQRISAYIARPISGKLEEALHAFSLAWQQPISNEDIRPVSHELANAVENAQIGLRAILASTDRGGLYENRALHLAAGEALGLEGYSSED